MGLLELFSSYLKLYRLPSVQRELILEFYTTKRYTIYHLKYHRPFSRICFKEVDATLEKDSLIDYHTSLSRESEVTVQSLCKHFTLCQQRWRGVTFVIFYMNFPKRLKLLHVLHLFGVLMIFLLMFSVSYMYV